MARAKTPVCPKGFSSTVKKVINVDVDGEPNSNITTDGREKSMRVSDINNSIYLKDILFELKKLNLHMSMINDTYIKDKDVE